MKDTAILYPVLVQVALTFFLQLWTAKARAEAFSRGEIKVVEPGITSTWSGRAAQISNAFHNQLEIPMLFYAVVAFALVTNGVDYIMVLLAWAFALSRIVHAFIHTTYNKVRHRFAVYLFGCVVVLLMWVKLGLHIATGA